MTADRRRERTVSRPVRRPPIAAIVCAGVVASGIVGQACQPASSAHSTPAASVAETLPLPPRMASDTVDPSVVPPDTAMPHDSLGAAMRRGLALLAYTPDSLPGYTGSNLRCLSCHLDGGRRADVAPLLGSYIRYPRYVDRTGAVVSIEERINYCFTRSLSGRTLPSTSREMQDIITYLSFLSTGVPERGHLWGEGLPRMPTLSGDAARGGLLFGPSCVRCHGAVGEGTAVAPALWGPRSYSIGASMAREERAASFIRRAMPYDRPGSLSDQDAFDLSAFINSHPRPDLPAKERDWPAGDAPSDVPYATRGHAAYRPPPVIKRTGDPRTMIVGVPKPVRGGD